jgi:DNA helicase INO80
VNIVPKPTAMQNGNLDHDITPRLILPLPKPRPDEKDIEAELAKIESADHSDLDIPGQELWKAEYARRGAKRGRDVGNTEIAKRKVRHCNH